VRQSFDPRLLVRLRSAEEVEIETVAAPGGPTHRTVIWVVVDASDRVLVRTYLGPGSRWYREAIGHPSATLWLDGESVPIEVVAATDPERTAACSEGYRTKYAGHSAMMAMLAAELLPTTLELLPR